MVRRIPGFLMLVLGGCSGGDGAEAVEQAAPVESQIVDADTCDEACTERAVACQAPSDVVSAACGHLCAGTVTGEMLDCIEATSCEDLAEAFFEGDDLCTEPGPPETCEATCDGANGLSESGSEASWVQGYDCEISLEDASYWTAGAAPGEACVDPRDATITGALGCAHHSCSCCGGDETFLASACVDDVCASKEESCALARTRAADPFFSKHLCD